MHITSDLVFHIAGHSCGPFTLPINPQPFAPKLWLLMSILDQSWKPNQGLNCEMGGFVGMGKKLTLFSSFSSHPLSFLSPLLPGKSLNHPFNKTRGKRNFSSRSLPAFLWSFISIWITQSHGVLCLCVDVCSSYATSFWFVCLSWWVLNECLLD